jgi:hypothetical protein
MTGLFLQLLHPLAAPPSQLRLCFCCQMFAHTTVCPLSILWGSAVGAGSNVIVVDRAWALGSSACDGSVRQAASCTSSAVCREAIGGLALGTACHSPQAPEAAAAYLGTLGALPARLREISQGRPAEELPQGRIGAVAEPRPAP